MAISIFISYARADKDPVETIYKFLLDSGMSPWMDVHNILPGENWERAINHAIKTSDVFIAVLTNNSVTRRGVLQKELKQGIDKLEEYLPGDIYFIPIRLDNCEIPERLGSIQTLDWENGRGKYKLLDAISASQNRTGARAVATSAPQRPAKTKFDLRQFLNSIDLPSDFSGGQFSTDPSGIFEGMVYTDFIHWGIHGRFRPVVNLQESGWVYFYLCKSENDAERRFEKLSSRGPLLTAPTPRIEKSVNLHGIGDKCTMVYFLGVDTFFPLTPIPIGSLTSQYEKDQYAKAVDEANIHDAIERFSITTKIRNAVFHVEAGDFKKLYWKLKDVAPTEDKFTFKRNEFINYIKTVEKKLKPLVSID